MLANFMAFVGLVLIIPVFQYQEATNDAEELEYEEEEEVHEDQAEWPERVEKDI